MRHLYFIEAVNFFNDANTYINKYKLNEDDTELHHATKFCQSSIEFLMKYILIMLDDRFDYSNPNKEGHNIKQLKEELEKHQDFYKLFQMDDQLDKYCAMITGWKTTGFYSELTIKVSLKTILNVCKIIENLMNAWDIYRNQNPLLIEKEENGNY